MKRDKLYTVGKNIRVNKFDGGGLFSKKNIRSTVGALGPVVGQVGSSLISGGYSDNVGSGITNLGGAVGGVISTVNPLIGGIVSAGSGIIGGAVNALFGTKVNKKNINAIEQNTANMNLVGNQLAGAGDSDSFFKMAGSMSGSSGFGTGDLVKGGLFSKGKARRRAQKYLDAEKQALAFQNHGMALGALGVDQNQDDNTLYHFSAYGGPLNMINNDNMGAIEYGFMSDWLANKKAKEERLEEKQDNNILMGEPLSTMFAEGGKIEIKHPGRLTELKKRTGKTEAELWAEGRPEVRKMITFARNARKWNHAFGGYLDARDKLNALSDTMFAIGGDLQSHGADWSNGATHVDAGGTHEENPNQGVQVGVDQNGTPDLVEEGEVIWNDYVYSNRIPIDEATKAKFHIGKKKEITYADLAKKLEKEIAERPNDPISQAGFKSQMSTLADEQERQKAEMEAERAKAAFEALSPEEQTALMQQAAQAEAARENLAAQEQANLQAEPTSTEEASMGEPLSTSEGQPMAEGGNLHPDGGFMKWWNDYIDLPLRNKKVNDIDYGKLYQSIVGAEGPTKSNDVQAELAKLYQTRPEAFTPYDIATYLFDKGHKVADFSSEATIPEVAVAAPAPKQYNPGFKDWWKQYVEDPAAAYSIRNIDASKIYEAVTGESANGADYQGVYDALNDLYGADSTQFGPFDIRKYAMLDEGPKTEVTPLEHVERIGLQPKPEEKEELEKIKMRNSAASKLRYVPAIGGAIGLAYDLLNRPDYSRADAIINASKNVTPMTVQPSYLGDYLAYRPMDIWAEQNRLDANARATDRAIRNSNMPTATKNASLLANAYNNQIASSELYKKALEYNDALREKIAGFNRGTNQFNAQMSTNVQQANQNAGLMAGRYGLQGIIQGNQMKDAIDAQRGASISANLGNLLQSIGDIGEEAYDRDVIKYLIDSGVGRGDFHKAKYGGMLTKKTKKGGKC